jgi:hypothetical protein
MLKEALRYLEKGFSVIPTKQDKTPYCKWEPWQKEKPSQEQVKEWWKKWPSANIALVTGELSNLMVIDTDTPEATQKIQDYIPENIITPIQSTPRDGRHFFFKHIEGFSNRAKVLPGVDMRTTGGYIMVSPSRNGEGKGWQWLDGLSLLDVDPTPAPDALVGFIKEFAFVLYKGDKNETTRNYKMFMHGTRDEDLFSVANSLIKDHWSSSDASQVIDILARNCIPSFSPNEAVEKVFSAIKRSERKDRNITRDVSDWARLQDGYWETTDCYRELHLTTRDEQKAAIVAIVRLKSEGIIESYGEKRGRFRSVNTSADEIDFMGTEEKILNFQWPFEIERWVKILPKNIIIIAGESNAGKTAFLLNASWLNMGKFKINYFSSEMGAMELRARLQKFEGNLQHWKDNVNFRERSSNFADVVKPNDVNIIDFLEVTEDFFKVGGMIKEIYDKLKKGIAIIALQKNKGRDLGLGAERSIEKARLYLSIESGKIKIVKGKNWANPEVNPNGMQWNFFLIGGSKFIIKTDKENKED